MQKAQEWDGRNNASQLIEEMRANLFVEQAALDVEQFFKRRLGGSLGRDIFREDFAELRGQVFIE